MLCEEFLYVSIFLWICVLKNISTHLNSSEIYFSNFFYFYFTLRVPLKYLSINHCTTSGKMGLMSWVSIGKSRSQGGGGLGARAGGKKIYYSSRVSLISIGGYDSRKYSLKLKTQCIQNTILDILSNIQIEL